MLPALADTPRKILPPPTTTAIWMPSPCACLISSATERATLTSMPKDCSPKSASPDNLSRTRRKAGGLFSRPMPLVLSCRELRDFVTEIVVTFCDTFTHLVAREAANSYRFANGRHLFGNQFSNGFLWRLDERLIKQHKLFIEFIEPSFDNLVDYLIRFVGILRIVLRLRAGYFALVVERVRGNFDARDVPWFSGGHMHGDILDELLELFAARCEVRFAIHFDQDADPAAHVDVRSNHAFGGHAAFFLFRGR